MADIKAEDFTRVATIFVPETVQAIAFSPDGSLLAVGAGDKVHVFRVPQSERTGSGEPSTPRTQA